MRGRVATALLFTTLAMAALPAAGQPQFTVVGDALIELIEIGKTSGVIGHSGDAVLTLGDGVDDQVDIVAGASDPVWVLVNTNVRTATFWPSGIVDLNMQSRARWSLSQTQIIPEAVWTPIEFDFDQTLTDPDHFDAQAESVPGGLGLPWTFFATEAGYYQVNSRTEYVNPRPDDPPGPVPAPPAPGPGLGVSIAIFKIDITGTIAMHSQGNNLQWFALAPVGGMIDPHSHEIFLEANNAPNVSDVVFLQAGEAIQIHAWWDGGFGGAWIADLVPGRAKTYVSVHKLS